MTDPLVVTIEELRRAVDHALTLAEAQLGSRVDLEANYYRHYWVKDVFDFDRSGDESTTGQLSDDLAHIRKNKSDSAPGEAWHELHHVTGLLRGLERLASP